MPKDFNLLSCVTGNPFDVGTTWSGINFYDYCSGHNNFQNYYFTVTSADRDENFPSRVIVS